MNVSLALLGAIEWDDLVRRWRTMTPAARDRVVILSALALVTLLLVIWAVVFRKRKPDSHSHSHYEYPRANDGDADAKSHKRRKWRRQRRPHRPLNPTLAQTGGLPPIRP